MSTPEDRELDAFLSRSGRLHAAWRDASAEEPPAALDEAIRAAARRAVRAGPRPAGGSFVTRWRVPMSIAAVLVVSATLTLLLSERGEHLPGADLRQAPAALEAPGAANAPARDAAKAADADERMRSAPGVADGARAPKQGNAPTADASGTVAEQLEADALGGRQLAKERAPRQPEAFPAPQDAKPAPQDARPAQQQEMPAQQQKMPAHQQSMPVQQESKLTQQETMPAQQRTEPAQQASARAERRDAQAPAAPQPEAVAELEARTKAETQAGALDDRAVPSESPAVAAKAPATASEATANQAIRGARAAAVPIPARPAAQAAEATKKREAQTADAALALEPKAWVERILALQREGKAPEAQRSLREFRRRYPDYPLPPDLAALLKAPVRD